MMSTKWKRSGLAMRTGLTDRAEWGNGDGGTASMARERTDNDYWRRPPLWKCLLQ